MKLEELITKFPWADHPLICTFAEDFTQQQWQLFADVDLAKVIEEDKLFDESLFAFLTKIKEVSSYGGLGLCLDRIEAYLFTALIKSDSTEKQRKLPFRSAIKCLLKFGFEKSVLNYFLCNISDEIALEYIFLTAAAICELNLTKKEKLHVLSQEWKSNLSFFSYCFVTHTLNPTLKEIFETLTTLTYEKYLAEVESKKFLFERTNTSDELKLFNKAMKEMRYFYDYSVSFLNRREVVNAYNVTNTLPYSANYLVLIADLHIEFNLGKSGNIMTITYEDGSSDKLPVSEEDKNDIIACDNLQDLLRHFPREEHVDSYNKIREYADSVESRNLFKAS